MLKPNSTRREPPTEAGKIGLLLRIAQPVFERYGLISKPYPKWIDQLEKELVGFGTVSKIKAYLIEVLWQRVKAH